MDNVLQKNICRTCLTEASGYKSLLSKMDGDDRTLGEILSSLTNVDISANDKYPKQVCDECHIMILKADEFKKRCLQSETILKNGFISHSFEELIKHEISSTEHNMIMVNTQIQNNLSGVSGSYFDSCLKNGHSGIDEIEIPLVDNFFNSTDNIKENINFVKEEQDDFLQDDMNDLAESIGTDNSPSVEIEQDDLLNANTSKTGLSTCVPNLENHTNEFEQTADKRDVTVCDNNKIPLVCIICNEELSSFELLQSHTLEHKDVIKSNNVIDYQCSLCTSRFICKKLLKNHIKTHKARLKQKKQSKDCPSYKQGIVLNLICPKCTENFSDMQAFQLHIKGHKNDPGFEKDKLYSIKLDSERQKFQCSMCMRKFVRKSSLTTHIKAHEDRAQIKYTCQTCKREFQHKAHLVNHVLVHSKEKGFTCHICSKSFSTQESLDNHKDRHKVDRKHGCKVCSKSFTMLSTLTEHLKIHTGEKPYLCSICGRGFSQKNNLSQHMRRHQGLKPFKCNTCERG